MIWHSLILLCLSTPLSPPLFVRWPCLLYEFSINWTFLLVFYLDQMSELFACLSIQYAGKDYWTDSVPLLHVCPKLIRIGSLSLSFSSLLLRGSSSLILLAPSPMTRLINDSLIAFALYAWNLACESTHALFDHFFFVAVLFLLHSISASKISCCI